MSPRLAVIYTLLVLMPLALLGWLGTKLAEEESERVQESLEGVMQQRLADMDRLAHKVMGDVERQLLEILDNYKGIPSSDSLRKEARKNRFVRQIFLRDADKAFIHPPLTYPEQTLQEKAFFERTRSVWESGIAFYQPTNDAWNVGKLHGWHTWFWGERINFLLWRQMGGGFEIGIELDTAALIAELIAQLPAETSIETIHGRQYDPQPDANLCIRLLDATGGTLYQWGNHEPKDSEKPKTEIALSAPLQMWNLQYFTNLNLKGPGTLPLHMIASLIALGLVLVALAYYFYRVNTRELRTATQRVSFVNQVSHELKTPLTNIRMYAELLESQIEEDSTPSAKKYLQVITDESRRLSRLIGNVLTFAKSQREELQIHKAERSPDAVINAVLDHFRPALETRKFEIETDLNAKYPMLLDADILEQILGNLINNVEKYGAQGKYLKIATNRIKDTLEIRVSDKGPGIPDAQKEAVFLPFHRVSHALSDGVTGTGIGLSIARNLARLHGGDLTIEDSKEGTTFRIELK